VEIRLKDGKPLLVGGGLIAGSQACCCENPPPAACWCPDYCQYKIAIVSPEQCAISTDHQCDNSSAARFTEPSLIQSALDAFGGEIGCPGEASGVGGLTLCGNYSAAYMQNHFMESYGLIAGTTSIVRKVADVAGVASGVGADVRYEARVYCSLMGAAGNIKPQIFLQLDLFVRLYNVVSSLGDLFFYYRSARKIVRIDSNDCELAGNRKCLYFDDTDRRTANFQTPLEFTLSIGTTSFGNYEEDALSGREFGPYQDVLDSLLETEFAATFRITSRPSCKTVPADCDVPIGEGNTRVIWGGTSAEFVLGTPELIVTTDPVTNDLLYYEHQGGSGTIVYPYKFFFYRTDNPNTQTLEQQYLDLYCESDNNVSPPVTAWYVVHQTIKICGAFTVDQWAGTIDTFAAPEDCGNISAGDPVPIGEPTMERSSGYPQDSSGGCGDPAPRIRFEIQAPCSV